MGAMGARLLHGRRRGRLPGTRGQPDALRRHRRAGAPRGRGHAAHADPRLLQGAGGRDAQGGRRSRPPAHRHLVRDGSRQAGVAARGLRGPAGLGHHRRPLRLGRDRPQPEGRREGGNPRIHRGHRRPQRQDRLPRRQRQRPGRAPRRPGAGPLPQGPGQGPHHRPPDGGVGPGPAQGVRRGDQEDAGHHGGGPARGRRPAREGDGGHGGHAAGAPRPEGRLRNQRRLGPRRALGAGGGRAPGHRDRRLRRDPGGPEGDRPRQRAEGGRRPASAGHRTEGDRDGGAVARRRERASRRGRRGRPRRPGDARRQVSLLSAAGLSKSFPGVRALEGVDFELRPGEVHALLGENGAGKSTLIKILGGALVPDAGTVRLEGQALPLGDPLAVRRRGINVVYQELTLVPDLTAAENIFLGREQGRPLLRRREMARAARELLDGLGARVAPGAPVRALSVAQQQLVEIARALANESKVIILDEPSATLSGPEVERLFTVLRGLRERGLGIVYISHRLEEIFALADRVTVLRDGRPVASSPVAGVDRAQLIRWMVGRDVAEEFPPRAPAPGEAVLEVRGLACPPRFTDVSLTVRRGGLVGAGRTSVALALFGALPGVRGEVRLEGRPVRFDSPFEAIRAGLGYVTEDRRRRGLFRLLSSGANITISYLRSLARLGLLSPGREGPAAAAAAKEFDVRAPAGLAQPAGTLSGGNQQKLLLARLLLRPRRLLVLDEPTRGIDVGAKAEIYALMNRL